MVRIVIRIPPGIEAFVYTHCGTRFIRVVVACIPGCTCSRVATQSVDHLDIEASKASKASTMVCGCATTVALSDGNGIHFICILFFPS